MSKNNFLHKHGLSIVLITLMTIFLVAQFFTGLKTENKELIEEGHKALSFGQYLQSGHFIETTFENWESEFLQMMLYVLLTVKLRQKGSSESKSLDTKEDVDRDLSITPLIRGQYEKAGFG